MRIIVLIFIVFLTECFTGSVFAHSEDIKKEQNDWNPLSAGPVTTWTAPLCGKGKFVVQPFLFYNRTRGTFNSEGHYNALPDGEEKSQYQEQLFIQYGLTEKLEIDAQAVYQENFRRQNENNAHSEGFGDSYAFMRYCLIEETADLPNIAALFQVKFPTGKYQNLDPKKLGTDAMGAASGGGSYDHGYGIILTKRIKPFVLHVDAVYSFPLEAEVNNVNTLYAPYLNYDLAMEYFLNKGFNIMLELNGFSQGDKKENGNFTADSNINYLILASGIGWSCEKFQTLLAYQRTLTGANADANDSIVFTVVHTF